MLTDKSQNEDSAPSSPKLLQRLCIPDISMLALEPLRSFCSLDPNKSFSLQLHFCDAILNFVLGG